MRGIVSKRLRREAYGNMAVQTTYEKKTKQKIETRVEKRPDSTGRMKEIKAGYFVNKDTIVCTGLRADYLKRKKAYVHRTRER
jgi:hypothetical protein